MTRYRAMTTFSSATSGSQGAESCGATEDGPGVFQLWRVGDAFKHLICGPISGSVDTTITKTGRTFLPGQKHPFPNVPALGKLGYLFADQRHGIGNCITDALQHDCLLAQGYTECARNKLG